MPVLDADVVLAIWLDEELAEPCVKALQRWSDVPFLISDFNALEVVLRTRTVLRQSIDAAFVRLRELCEVRSLTPEELKQVARFRTGKPALTLGDAYSAALADGQDVALVSTDARFAQIRSLRDRLVLIRAP